MPVGPASEAVICKNFNLSIYRLPLPGCVSGVCRGWKGGEVGGCWFLFQISVVRVMEGLARMEGSRDCRVLVK